MCAAITTAAIGVAATAYSIYSGEQQKAEAKKAIENLEVPELENPYEDMRISTMGSDLVKEEGQRRTATMVDELRGGGARNVMSAIPGLVAMNNDINQQAKKEIDDQMLNREQLIATYGEKRNQYEEDRYQGALAGYGQMYYQGQQQTWSGIRTGITSLGSLGRAIQNKPRPKAQVLGGDLPTKGVKPLATSSGLENVGLTQSDLRLAPRNEFSLENNFGYLSNIPTKR